MGRRRVIYPPELDLLLSTAGFEVVHRWGDPKRTPFVNPAKQKCNYLMRRAPATNLGDGSRSPAGAG